MPINDDKVIFRVPIYKDTPDEFYKSLKDRRDKIIQQKIASVTSFYQDYYSDPNNLPHPNPDKISWKYNRIVGWIELYLNGQVIKADSWKIRLKRIPNHFNPNYFDQVGKIADVCHAHKMDNDEIKEKTITFFTKLNNGRYGNYWFKNYFIYTGLLYKQIKYLDIKEMIMNES